MSKLEFPGKVGQVSGFDAENDATVVLVLETLLAGYAKIAIQPTGIDMESRNIVMRPVDMGTYGRHFFLLPTNKGEIVFNHTLFRVGYKDELKTESDSRKRTVIKSLLTKQTSNFHKADRDTIVGPKGEKLPKNFHTSFTTPHGDWELYYVDVKDDWKTRDYFMFMIKIVYTKGDQDFGGWRFLSFFKREAELNAHEQSIVTYLKHLVAGNVSNRDITSHTFEPKSRRFFPTQLEDGSAKAIKSSPIISDTVIPNKFSFPESDPWSWNIVPSVVFTAQNGYILTPWAQGYASLLTKYIGAIRTHLKFDASDQIARIESMRKPPDYELVLGTEDEELMMVSVFYVTHMRRRLPTIAIRDSNIARLVFGCNSEWERRGRDTDEKISTPGFGCLDNLVCRKAVSGLADSTWVYFTSSATKNGDINEMLGRTSDEIDSLLFEDATFYRSFIGKSVSYVDAVAHWMRLQKEPNGDPIFSGDDIDQMRQQAKGLYRKAFQSYIENVFGSMILTDSSGSSGGGSRSRSNYIQTLQSGYEFNGFSARSTEDRKDTTKLVYHIDSSKFFAVRGLGSDRVSKRIDGGLYLYASYMDVKPRSSIDVIAKAKVDVCVPEGKVKMAHTDIVYSSFCPYGYVARSLFKILDFTGGHVEFFPTTRVHGIIGGQIGLYRPNNCVASRITLVSGAGQDDHLEATPTGFFTNDTEEGPGRGSTEMNKIYLSTLPKLKDIWLGYIYTRSYIRSLLPLKNENDPNVDRAKKNKDINQERYLALGLAQILRYNAAMLHIARSLGFAFITEGYIRTTKHRDVVREAVRKFNIDKELLERRNRFVVNIYDLMPYYRDGIDSNQNPERLAFLEQKYPNVTRNFYANCDTIYKLDRLNLLWKAHETLGQSDVFTNLDYVHGFLLAENFVLNRDGRDTDYPSYMNRDQYMALSASVVYTSRKTNEYVDLTKTEDTSSDSDESSSGNEEKPERMFPETRYVGGLDDSDVVRMFAENRTDNRVSKTVFVNLANVPIYNVDAGKNTDGDVFVSTLNEALSVNSSFVSLLARSLHVKEELHNKPDGALKFDFVHGREIERVRGITDLNEHRRTAPVNATLGDMLPAEFKNPEGGSATSGTNQGWSALLSNADPFAPPEHEGQDMTVRKSYSIAGVSIVTRVRNQLTAASYIPKNTRARILITEAAKNRIALRLLQPAPRKNAYEKTLAETTIVAEIQVPRVIHVDRNYSNSIPIAQFSDDDVQAYYQVLGIAS